MKLLDDVEHTVRACQDRNISIVFCQETPTTATEPSPPPSPPSPSCARTEMRHKVQCATQPWKLLGAPGLTTRSKKLLGAPGIATRSKKLLGAPGHTTRSKKQWRRWDLDGCRVWSGCSSQPVPPLCRGGAQGTSEKVRNTTTLMIHTHTNTNTGESLTCSCSHGSPLLRRLQFHQVQGPHRCHSRTGFARHMSSVVDR